MIRVQRVYEPLEHGSDVRVLVDRLWPRGVKKEGAPFSEWARDASPSAALRRWVHEDPARWPEFVRRYHVELDEHPEAWSPLLAYARSGDLTLLYASRDTERNNAIVLARYLEARMEAS